MLAPDVIEQRTSDSLDLSAIVYNEVSSRTFPARRLPIKRAEVNEDSPHPIFFATNDQELFAHVYNPREVFDHFEQDIVPLFRDLPHLRPMSVDDAASTLLEETLTYLHFHELFHPVFLPKSQVDRERFNVALQRGIQQGDSGIDDRDAAIKAGNVANLMWDYLIDTFYTHFTSSGNNRFGVEHAKSLHKNNLGTPTSLEGRYASTQHPYNSLTDGVVTTWDVMQLAGADMKRHESASAEQVSEVYAVTRTMYGLLHCDDKELRRKVVEYFKSHLPKSIAGHHPRNFYGYGLSVSEELFRPEEVEEVVREAIVGSFRGTIDELTDSEVEKLGTSKNDFYQAAETLYDDAFSEEGTKARREVARVITEINTNPHLRYRSIEGIVRPLSKLISEHRPEGRESTHADPGTGEPGEPSQVTPQEVLQSIINQNDPDSEQTLANIANATPHESALHEMMSTAAKDEHYKKVEPIPLKSPHVKPEKRVRGEKTVWRQRYTELLTVKDIARLQRSGEYDRILKFQQRHHLPALVKVTPHQWKRTHYTETTVPIMDHVYQGGATLDFDNIILRVDQSGSMGTASYVGDEHSRYDALMRNIYGIMKSAVAVNKEQDKEVNVVTVSFSNRGQTRVSEPVELQEFYRTSDNNAKNVLLNPESGLTYHDPEKFQEALDKLPAGRTLDIMITDGAIDNTDKAFPALQQYLRQPDVAMLFVQMLMRGETTFSRGVKGLSRTQNNVTYRNIQNIDDLEGLASGIMIKYD